MSLVQARPFAREVLDQYESGDVLLHSAINPKFGSLSYLIQKISAPIMTKKPVLNHVADIVMINGIPHVQSILEVEHEKKGWKFWKNVENYKTGTIPLVEYLKFYNPKETNIYYCPLSDEVRAVFDKEAWLRASEMQDGANYASLIEFIKTGVDDEQIDWLDKYVLKWLPFYKKWIPVVLKRLFENSKISSRFTCSAGHSHKATWGYMQEYNYSEDTPQDVGEMRKFKETNYLILGMRLEQIYQYNSKPITLK